jgi:2-amino-4-hydroxy-6-hydroxymethyldihydropteridine diphosphokinase
MSLSRVLLCLGGNEGDRFSNLEEARDFCFFNIGDVVAASSIYESPAWGMENAAPFLNQVLMIETELSPQKVLQEILEMEEYFGRERSVDVYLDREMDVDILYYEDQVIDEPSLQVPHPRLYDRRFVLQPLAEIAPDWIDPVKKVSAAELLRSCTDESVLKIYGGV